MRRQPALYKRELSRDYHVFTCADEHTALEILRTRPISAVVLEPAMSNERGWQLLTTMQAIGGRSVPIVLCSILDERRKGRDLGAAAYLVKPTLPATLRDTLRQVMQQVATADA